jgi:hypothetical protein
MTQEQIVADAALSESRRLLLAYLEDLLRLQVRLNLG